MAVDPRKLKVGDKYLAPKKYIVCERTVELVREDGLVTIEGAFIGFDSDDYWKDAELIKSACLGHPRFLALLDQLRAMHLAKSADYGTAEDIFSNFRGSAALGVAPWVGAMIRAKDKVRRIESFVGNGTLKNEPLMDSFLDLASYALIAAVLFEEAKDGTK